MLQSIRACCAGHFPGHAVTSPNYEPAVRKASGFGKFCGNFEREYCTRAASLFGTNRSMSSDHGSLRARLRAMQDSDAGANAKDHDLELDWTNAAMGGRKGKPHFFTHSTNLMAKPVFEVSKFLTKQ
jgi:hypothetical protein